MKNIISTPNILLCYGGENGPEFVKYIYVQKWALKSEDTDLKQVWLLNTIENYMLHSTC